MKQEVEVDGARLLSHTGLQNMRVRLTRVQVEQALVELNAPEEREIGRFGTEAFRQTLGPERSHYYYLPFSAEDVKTLRQTTGNDVPGVVVRPDGTSSVSHRLAFTRTVTAGVLDGYPVIKGRLVFIPEEK